MKLFFYIFTWKIVKKRKTFSIEKIGKNNLKYEFSRFIKINSYSFRERTK